MSENIINLASIIATKIKRNWSALKGLKGARAFFKLAPKVVKEVEEVGVMEGLKGADKKEMATEVILELLPVSSWPWWMPRALAKILISMAIEGAVTEMNKLIKRHKG